MSLFKCFHLSLILLVLTNCVGFAQETETPLTSENNRYSWNQKLARGFANLGTFPWEIVKSFSIEHESYDVPEGQLGYFGATANLMTGLERMMGRLFAGMADIVTFPVNFPVSGRAPLIQPEYVWQSASEH